MFQRILRAALAGVTAFAGYIAALPVLLVVLPFWVIGRLTHALAGILDRRKLEWREYIHYEPDIGWKPRAGMRGYAADMNGDLFWVTTDEEGWRGECSLADSDVIVLGDSFAFGYGVDDDEFFGRLCAQLKVKGIGAPGYSMVQPVLLMRRLADQLKGKLVFWLVYLGNDLDDSLSANMMGYRSPFVRRTAEDGYEIITDHVRNELWTFEPAQKNYEAYVRICSPTRFSDRVFGACEYLVKQASQICAAAGAGLVVATVPEYSDIQLEQVRKGLANLGSPEHFDPELPDRRLSEICARWGTPFIPLKEHLTPDDYFEHDPHWRPRGHRRVAAVIEEAHRQHVLRSSTAGVEEPDDVRDVVATASTKARP